LKTWLASDQENVLADGEVQRTPTMVRVKGLEMGEKACESRTMSATAIREKRQTTLPADVSEAAGLELGDQVDWRFEDGEIRGRKLVHQPEPKRIVRKLIMRDGELVMDTTGLTIDEDDIATAVREERDRH